jgi:protein involved in polysaccharide export with SLBB domain
MASLVRAGALAFVGAALLAVAGCGPTPTVEGLPPANETAGAAAPAYRLRSGDSIHIGFVTDRSLSLDTPITPAGTVTLPLVGDVKAAGKTSDELAREIKELMRPYLLDPEVAVVIISVGVQPVFVLGEVAKPGRLDSAEVLTVSRAVASAGGLLPTAQAGSVMVVRTVGVERPTAYKVDLANALSAKDLAQDIELRSNDVVYVPKSVIGDVGEFVSLFFNSIIPAELFLLHGYDVTHLENRGWWQ